MTTKRVARIGVGSALAIALAYATAPIPNVELLTLTVFLVGYVGGALEGACVGAISAAVYFTFNPWGAGVPLVVAAQMAGEMIAGVVGAAAGTFSLARSRAWWSYAAFALLGAGATVIYDVVVTAAGALLFGVGEGFVALMIAGLAFSILHVASNAVLFALAVPAAERIAAWAKRTA